MFSLATLFLYMLFVLPTAFSVWFAVVFALMVIVLVLKVIQFVKATLPFNS